MDQELRQPLEEAGETTEEKMTGRPVEVFTDRGADSEPDLEGRDIKALALAYAKYLAEKGLEPGDITFADYAEVLGEEPVDETEEEAPAEETPTEEAEKEPAAEADEEAPVEEELDEEAPVEEAEEAEEAEDEPAEKAETEPDEEAQAEETEEAEETAEERSAEPEKKSEKTKKKPARARESLTDFDVELTDDVLSAAEAALSKRESMYRAAAATVDLIDRIKDKIDGAAVEAGKGLVIYGHRIAASYSNSRRIIGAAVLVIGILAAVILTIFDSYTVYEYSYNGRHLGYVREQSDAIDVLDIAGAMLTENSAGHTEIKFTANQNVTFTEVDGRDKSVDDSDAVVNKLVYMTDIETQAFGIYEDGVMIAAVKSEEDANRLLERAREELSEPDEGMTVISSEFMNPLSIQPVNMMLTSVQSNSDALTTMTEGGRFEIYHIVEENESLTSLAETFGVEMVNIFNETNTEVATEIEQGDTVCIHCIVEPVSVKMVETGRMREIIEYDTIKQDSDEYYKGDTYVLQEGRNGSQIFEGTVTKVSGTVVDRDTLSLRVTAEKQDKIILIGTAERPKTAPTGTFIVPLRSYEGISSPFGYRWGRLHSGIDMGAHYGTPIYAADGGTVIMAGWYGGYGLCVDIDHGNGRVTRYGHCSKLLVNAGDQVFQGQNIAEVGSTGHSFGNHLHFEIRLNDTPVNPRPYLGI